MKTNNIIEKFKEYEKKYLKTRIKCKDFFNKGTKKNRIILIIRSK